MKNAAETCYWLHFFLFLFLLAQEPAAEAGAGDEGKISWVFLVFPDS